MRGERVRWVGGVWGFGVFEAAGEQPTGRFSASTLTRIAGMRCRRSLTSTITNMSDGPDHGHARPDRPLDPPLAAGIRAVSWSLVILPVTALAQAASTRDDSASRCWPT